MFIIYALIFVCICSVFIYFSVQQNIQPFTFSQNSSIVSKSTNGTTLQQLHQHFRTRSQHLSSERVQKFASFPILVIHLARSKDREQHMKDQMASLQGLPMTFIEAVDGNKITNMRHVNIEEFDFDVHAYRSVGEHEDRMALACLLSHIRAIHHAWVHKLGTVCICEDDASFFLLPYWSKTLKEVAEEAPPMWEMILLYHNSIGVSQNTQHDNLMKSPSRSNGRVAYIVSPRGQQKIASLFNENGVMTRLPTFLSSPGIVSADETLYDMMSPNMYTTVVPMVYPLNSQHNNESIIHPTHTVYHNDHSVQYMTMYLTKSNASKSALALFEKKPPLWQCWTGDYRIPPYLSLCRETVKKWNDPYFHVILLTPDNLHHYLQDIHPSYDFLSYVHRADYLRVMLLYHYGGVYLDMDTIGLSPLKDELHISKSVDIVGYNGKQWGELWGMGALGPVKRHCHFYKVWKDKMHALLDQKYALVRSFRKQHPTDLNKDPLGYLELLGGTGIPLQKIIKHSYFLVPSWAPSSLEYKKSIEIVNDTQFKNIQSQIATLPVLIIINSAFPDTIRKASKKEIYQSDIFAFRLIASSLQKPFIYAYPYIDKILYINLDHRPDRRRDTEKELDRYFQNNAITRISAIYTPQNGHYGCLQSHVKALRHAVTNYPGENILICEDDVQFNHDPRKVIDMFFKDKYTHDWDALLLGHSQEYHKTAPIASNGFVRVTSTNQTTCFLLKGRYVPILLKLYSDDLETYHRTKVWTDTYCTDQSWKKLMLKDRWYAFKERRVAGQRLSYSDIDKKVVEHYHYHLTKG